MSLSIDFLISVISIIAIDIVLGGDNAIVIALACRNLPESKRNKAIFFGTGLAVVVRILLTLVVVYLLKIPFLLLIGGFLLIFIAFHLLVDQHDQPDIKSGATLMGAIQTIVFADLVMGLDNVLAIAGAAQGEMGLVITGLLISVPIIVWGSKLILYAMERFPSLIYIGGGVLAFTAARMITNTPQMQSFFAKHPTLTYGFWTLIIVSVLFSGWMTNRTAK